MGSCETSVLNKSRMRPLPFLTLGAVTLLVLALGAACAYLYMEIRRLDQRIQSASSLQLRPRDVYRIMNSTPLPHSLHAAASREDDGASSGADDVCVPTQVERALGMVLKSSIEGDGLPEGIVESEVGGGSGEEDEVSRVEEIPSATRRRRRVRSGVTTVKEEK